MQKIAVLTAGLWRLRREVAAVSAMQPVRWDSFPRPAFDAVAGWGFAATADRARRLASRRAVPYVAFEDGPLRSVRPGPAEPPMSLVMDRSGIYYDATSPSDLIGLILDHQWFTPAIANRAVAARDEIRRLRLSKYNSGSERSAEELALTVGASRVLVLDQVRDDASIRGGLADAGSFDGMLQAAVAENPESEVIVKLHPDVLSGRRAGYFSGLKQTGRVKLVAEQINPWSLLDAVDKVYTVSSGLGFEAALAGKEVVCFGSPFYAGWGFTDDRRPRAARPGQATPLQLFAAYYLRYARYLDAYSREETTFERAIDQLAWLRDRFFSQPRRSVCFGITRWKRPAFNRLLDSPNGPPLYAPTPSRAIRLAKAQGAQIVTWASRTSRSFEAACEQAGIDVVRAEDGFVRSAGLGASFVPPLSLAFDRRGIYYDATRTSDLEAMIEAGEFPSQILERARRLRETLVARGTTKYNVGSNAAFRIDSGGRPVVLVPGQVEDDASIRLGSPAMRRNIDLLAAARARHPNAFVLYKPHPDVEAGFRRGRIPPAAIARFADAVARNASILQLIEACDRLETMTSLAGFEALLRGKPVATHGQPFYSGWGLTEDLQPAASRTRKASLDELVAAALILYPLYLDPRTNLPCEPELLVDRLGAAGADQVGARALLRFGQIWLARGIHVGRSVKSLVRGHA